MEIGVYAKIYGLGQNIEDGSKAWTGTSIVVKDDATQEEFDKWTAEYSELVNKNDSNDKLAVLSMVRLNDLGYTPDDVILITKKQYDDEYRD